MGNIIAMLVSFLLFIGCIVLVKKRKFIPYSYYFMFLFLFITISFGIEYINLPNITHIKVIEYIDAVFPFLDAGTTELALRNGGRETNPVVAFPLRIPFVNKHRKYFLLLIASLICLFIVSSWSQIVQDNSTEWYLTLVYSFVIINNSFQLYRVGKKNKGLKVKQGTLN